MDIVITMKWTVRIEGDRASVEEIVRAVDQRLDEAKSAMARVVVETYQEQILQTLCSGNRPSAKKGWAVHPVKRQPGRACGHRSFRRAGSWSRDRQVRTTGGTVRFRPALIECRRCGKRLTPILEGLGLRAHQTGTWLHRRAVIEASLDSSYRRAVAAGGLSVSKSTAQRWAQTVELPVPRSVSAAFTGADGIKFKGQGGRRGEVRLVAQMSRDGRMTPLGVWAGTAWKQIARQVRRRQVRRASQFLSDGEPAIERWLGPLGRRCGRCLWHLQRDSRYVLWADHAGREDRRRIRRRLRRIVSLSPAVPEGEPIRPAHRRQLRRQIDAAHQDLDTMRKELIAQGYVKTAGYLARAQGKLFSHLELWLQTGRLGLKTTSWIESMMAAVALRLKKVGWNWSDAGAARISRMVLWRRYVPTAWRQYWHQKTPQQGRCRIQLVTCERKAA
jgi:hypothetical protein